jgi:glycosyltransferase involved in cell wall biosynthesis
MKVVFLTPDHLVDRRIVLQAKSLGEGGHESVIIADLGSGKEEDRSYSYVSIVNAISYEAVEGGASPGRRTSLFATLKDPMKKLLGGYPSLRRFFRTAYSYFFHCLQCVRPHEKRRLSPLEDDYYARALSYDAYVYVACDLPMLPPAARAAAARNVVLVYDAHEFYTGQVILSPPERAVARDFERNLIGRAHQVITVNASIARLFARHYGIPEPAVIYNCTTPPPSFDRTAPHRVIHDRLSLPEGTKIVLFQGGYLQGRNLENLVRAGAELFDGIALVLLGFGEYRAYLETLARARRRNNVFFIDAVSQEELLDYSAAADLGIIPYQPIDVNTRFCTPNKFFEFIQAGLPILAEGRLEELKGFIEGEGIGFLRDLSTPKAIASALNEIISGDEGLCRARERCGTLSSRYHWDEEGRKFTGLIEKAWEESRRQETQGRSSMRDVQAYGRGVVEDSARRETRGDG